MKHYKSINKLYYDILLKEDIDDRPFFIMQYENGYITFLKKDCTIKKFHNYKIAEMYVNQKFHYPQIITINFKKRD